MLQLCHLCDWPANSSRYNLTCMLWGRVTFLRSLAMLLPPYACASLSIRVHYQLLFSLAFTWSSSAELPLGQSVPRIIGVWVYFRQRTRERIKNKDLHVHRSLEIPYSVPTMPLVPPSALSVSARICPMLLLNSAVGTVSTRASKLGFKIRLKITIFSDMIRTVVIGWVNIYACWVHG